MTVDEKGNGLGLTSDNAKIADDKSDDLSSEDDYDCQFELSIVVDMIKSPLNKIDEFSQFSDALNLASS
jgi:hypothetical protein